MTNCKNGAITISNYSVEGLNKLYQITNFSSKCHHKFVMLRYEASKQVAQVHLANLYIRRSKVFGY